MSANICRWLNFQNIQTAHTIQYQKTPNNPIKKWAEDSHFSEEVTQMVNQVRSVAQLCPTLCDPVNCSMPGLPVHHQLPEFTQLISIKLVMPSSHLILCHPLLLLPPIFPSIRVFPDKSTLHISWPKYWSFNFSNSPSNEYSGLISWMSWVLLYQLSHQGSPK